MDGKAEKVLERLQAQCSRREYCSADILKKATEKLDGDSQAAAEILSSLIEDRFVDDLRYASAFAREKSALTGWGPVKIRMALAAKGIRGETADLALRETDPQKSEEKLERLLESKWKSLADDPQGKLKLLRFALSRGYEYDQVKNLVDSLTSR